MAYNQPYWRFREDLDALNNEGSGWFGALNTDPELDAGTIYRWRVEVEEDAGGGTSTQFKIQYRYKPYEGSFGSWTDVPIRDENGVSGPLVAWNSAQYVDGAATTNLMSGSSEAFQAGEGCWDRQINTGIDLDNEHTELEFCFLIVGTWKGPTRITDNSEIELRIIEGDDTVFGGSYVTPLITVNVPDYFIGSIYPESHHHVGPFKDTNGNLYILVEPTHHTGGGNNEPEFLKSADGGKTWELKDTLGSPAVNDLEGADVFQDGDTLHVVIQSGAGGDPVTYHKFTTSDHGSTPDEWTEIDTSIEVTCNAGQQACGVVVRSDSDVIVFYRYSDGQERVAYKIYTGTWSARTIVDTTASVDFTFAGVVIGASDLTHIFYRDETNATIYHKSLSSGDSLSARESVEADASTSSNRWGAAPPVYWDSSGNEKIMTFVRDDSDGYLYSVVITNDGTPEARKQISANAIDEDNATNDLIVAHGHVDPSTDTVYVIWADETDRDLDRDSAVDDGGWGTDQSERVGFITQITGEVFTHSSGNGGDTVFGYWYEDVIEQTDAGLVGMNWYGEYVIAAGGAVSMERGIGRGVGRGVFRGV